MEKCTISLFFSEGKRQIISETTEEEGRNERERIQERTLDTRMSLGDGYIDDLTYKQSVPASFICSSFTLKDTHAFLIFIYFIFFKFHDLHKKKNRQKVQSHFGYQKRCRLQISSAF